MTDKELTEKIAEEGVGLYNFPNLWNRLNKGEKDNWRQWAKTKILPLIEEAGYVLPNSKGCTFDSVIDTLKPEEMLHQWAKDNGYVKLAKDQGLPNQYGRVSYERLKAVLIDHKIDVGLLDCSVGEAQVDLLNAGFRRVDL